MIVVKIEKSREKILPEDDSFVVIVVLDTAILQLCVIVILVLDTRILYDNLFMSDNDKIQTYFTLIDSTTVFLPSLKTPL